MSLDLILGPNCKVVILIDLQNYDRKYINRYFQSFWRQTQSVHSRSVMRGGEVPDLRLTSTFMIYLIFCLAVKGSAVLISILVRFTFFPVLVPPWCSRHPHPASFVVQVSPPHPPGVLQVSSICCNDHCNCASNLPTYIRSYIA